jgi:hypothetical protein
MANYFRKYYFIFQDNHITNPVTWRVDIFDSEGDVPTEPFLLISGSEPLITERVNTNEDKSTGVIGRQITISYYFDGAVNTPLPKMFFEGTEKRFRVEVRRNNVLDGVYYIKPDDSEYPDSYPPFEVQLKAIDGFGYADGTKFYMYDEDQLIKYDKITLYEALMTRSMLQIIDPDTVINVSNSLVPNNMSILEKYLFGVWVHTDIYIDFVSGASSVLDVLNSICMSLYARIYIENNELWLIRTQDLGLSSLNVDKYTDSTTVTTFTLDQLMTTGPDPSAYDTMPIDGIPTIRMYPAIKKATFSVKYKAISRLANFDWRDFGNYGVGDQFQFWGIVPGNAPHGSGTIDDPFTAFLPYDAGNPGVNFLQQNPIDDVFLSDGVGSGDIIQIAFNWKVINVEGFKIRVWIRAANPGSVAYLDSSGSWIPGVSTFIEIKRTKKKQLGSFKLNSAPIPSTSGGFSLVGVELWIEIYTPNPQTTPNTQDGPGTPGIELYPIKLGAASSNSEKRISVVENEADFSAVQDDKSFTFLTTNDPFLSNTLFINAFGFLPAIGWDNDKTGVQPLDIEQHMSTAYVDQYQRSVTAWEGKLYSNTLSYFNTIQFSHMLDKKFMQVKDEYNNITCTHNILLMEIFDEGTSINTYTEYDSEEETD